MFCKKQSLWKGLLSVKDSFNSGTPFDWTKNLFVSCVCKLCTNFVRTRFVYNTSIILNNNNLYQGSSLGRKHFLAGKPFLVGMHSRQESRQVIFYENL